MRTLYLCGAGNPEGVRLAQAVNRAAGRWECVVLLDDDVAKHGQRILGVDVAGPFAALADALARNTGATDVGVPELLAARKTILPLTALVAARNVIVPAPGPAAEEAP